VRRLSDAGGDPVVQLQTNFGGGKTHSMLALYHLFSGTSPSDLLGIDAVLNDAGVGPAVNRRFLAHAHALLDASKCPTAPSNAVTCYFCSSLSGRLLLQQEIGDCLLPAAMGRL
jgi:hypothetical protein